MKNKWIGKSIYISGKVKWEGNCTVRPQVKTLAFFTADFSKNTGQLDGEHKKCFGRKGMFVNYSRLSHVFTLECDQKIT